MSESEGERERKVLFSFCFLSWRETFRLPGEEKGKRVRRIFEYWHDVRAKRRARREREREREKRESVEKKKRT